MTASLATQETLQDRHRDWALVDRSFRTSKTVHLEVRPVYVRRATRTREHAVVVMPAYRIVQELARCWRAFDLTVEEGLKGLSERGATDWAVKGRTCGHQVPGPRAELCPLLEAAGVRLPEVFVARGVRVAPKRKLPERRKTP